MFGDDESLKKVMSSNSPGEIKALGSKINNFNAVIWTQSAPKIANECHHAKFNQNPALADNLLATGENKLIETFPNVSLLGIGVSMYDAMIMTKQSQWGKTFRAFIDESKKFNQKCTRKPIHFQLK